MNCRELDIEPCTWCVSKYDSINCWTKWFDNKFKGEFDKYCFIKTFGQYSTWPEATFYLVAVIKHKYPECEKLLVLI
jgi:hypothetical protein